MDRISLASSDKIALLSFVGAVLICIFHVPWPRGTAGADLFCGFIDSIGLSVLSFFFAFAGYLLARHWQESGWWRRAVVKRIATLVVPYLIWLLAFLCLFVYIHPTDFSFFHYDTIWSVLGFVPWNPPRLVPYWFMRCLFGFVLISPLVVKAVAAGRGILLLAVAYALDLVYWTCVAFGVIGMETPRVGSFFWYGFNIDGFVYFAAGVYLAMRPVAKPSIRVVCLCGVAAVLLIASYLVCMRFDWCRYVHPAAVVAPFLLVFVWEVLPDWKLPRLFRSVMFPIYLLHIFVLEVWCYYRTWSNRGYPECLLMMVVAIGLPILVSKALHRVAPRLAAILFGGR